MNQEFAGLCQRDGHRTIMKPAVPESTGYVSPYRLNVCPFCNWQQWEHRPRLPANGREK